MNDILLYLISPNFLMTDLEETDAEETDAESLESEFAESWSEVSESELPEMGLVVWEELDDESE